MPEASHGIDSGSRDSDGASYQDEPYATVQPVVAQMHSLQRGRSLPTSLPRHPPSLTSCYRSGTWKFYLASGVRKAPPGFQDPSFSDIGWDDIKVPGHWQLQDAGSTDPPIYTNTNYPFPNHPPYAPRKNPTGLYRRTFAVPAGWLRLRSEVGTGGGEGLTDGERVPDGSFFPVKVWYPTVVWGGVFAHCCVKWAPVVLQQSSSNRRKSRDFHDSRGSCWLSY